MIKCNGVDNGESTSFNWCTVITFHENTLHKPSIYVGGNVHNDVVIKCNKKYCNNFPNTKDVADGKDALSPCLGYLSVDSTVHATTADDGDDIWRQVFSISPFLYTVIGLVVTCVTVLLCSLFPCKLCVIARALITLFRCRTPRLRVHLASR